jgi:uncharacterized RDD family membrane protein YckC
MIQHNPYAAPTEPSDAPEPPTRDSTAPAPLPLASRSARFAGAFIDHLVEWGSRWVVVELTRDSLGRQAPSTFEEARRLTSYSQLAVFGSTTIVLAVQAFLVARRDQSLGKMFTGTRIVRSDGRPAGFLRAFVLRTLPFNLFMWLMLFAILSLPVSDELAAVWMIALTIDALLVFGSRRRCGHDLLAGTVVVQTAPRHAAQHHHEDRTADAAGAPARRTRQRTRKPKKAEKPAPPPADLP